jgi:hypothetical protein
MKVQSFQASSQFPAKKIPIPGQKPLTWQPNMTDRFIATKAPGNSPSGHLRFAGCMCPICLSIGIIENAYNSIDKIKQGETIEAGGLMRNISAQTQHDYMVHDHATRLVTPAQCDDNRIKAAVMERQALHGAAKNQIKLEIPAEGSLFTTVCGAFAKVPQKPVQYRTYPKSMDTVPLCDISLTPPADPTQPTLLSIVHQMFPEDNKPHTTPVSMGYVLTQVLEPKSNELVMVSAREFPTMENMDIAPTGLTNLLGLLAHEQFGKFDTLAVVVEPQQEDLKGYLNHLKAVGIPVKPYVGNPAQIPNSLKLPSTYQTTIERLFPKQAPSVYQVDLKPIKHWLKNGLPSETIRALVKADPDLRSKVPSANQTGLSGLEFVSLFHVPPAAGATMLNGQSHQHEEDVAPLPKLTFDPNERYTLNLND